MKTRTLMLAALCSLSLTTAVADEHEGKQCFQTKRVHTVKVKDDKHVIAELMGGERYLLGVEENCRHLDKAVQFAVKSRGTRVCANSFAELAYSERSNRSDTCRIETVELLADDAEDDAAPEDGSSD